MFKINATALALKNPIGNKTWLNLKYWKTVFKTRLGLIVKKSDFVDRFTEAKTHNCNCI